ncbi:hypothetical protein ROZALSC1DRAFT_30654, partial [Rozella allomycis CSF55]
MENISLQIQDIECLLEKRFDLWSDEDKERYGTEDGKKDKQKLNKVISKLEDMKILLTEYLMKKEDQLNTTLLREGRNINGPQVNGTDDLSNLLSKMTLEDSKKKISPNLTSSSGLISSRDLILCTRDAVKKQIEFLTNVSDENSGINIAWIQGAPGVGKSITTLSFIPNWILDGWTVSWINVSVDGAITAFRVVNQCKTNYKMDRDSVYDWLNEVLDKHVAVIDGNHIDVMLPAVKWYRETEKGRRLCVVVSSLASSKKNRDREDVIYKSATHIVSSWTLDEYMTALDDDDMWQSVCKNIQVQGESKEESIRSKFFVAGASARYMFDFSMKQAIERYTKAIKIVPDYMTLMDKGIESSTIVSRLIGVIDGQKFIVSRFAARKLAFKLGVAKIDDFVSTCRNFLNPAMFGWLFEMRFFALLGGDGVRYILSGQEYNWPYERVYDFDSKYPDLMLFSNQDNKWLKPINWKEGGYDAIRVVFLKKEKAFHYRLEFFQVSRAISHTLKLQYFYSTIKNIIDKDANNNIVFDEIRIFFVSPIGSTSKISSVESSGLLTEFGWTMNKEIDMVEYVQI